MADLLEANADEFAALEALNVGKVMLSHICFPCCNSCAGKAFTMARMSDLPGSIAVLRYYSGWADKIQGKTIEVGTAAEISTHFGKTY